MPSGVYKRNEAQKEWARNFFKGNTYNKGKKQTEEVKARLSLVRKGKSPWNKGLKGYNSGAKHYKWRGVSKEERSWVKNKRNRVIKRLRVDSLSHTFGEWELLKKQYGFSCPCCKKTEPEIKLTEDHIIPLSKGGSDLIENIQPLCFACNLQKHTKIIKF